MTRDEFKNIVKAIHAAYQSNPITSQRVFDLWYAMLKDAEYTDVSAALERHIKTNRFAPTIAELRSSAVLKNRFSNFLPRGYDMDKLELALLGIKQPRAIEDSNGGRVGVNAVDGSDCRSI